MKLTQTPTAPTFNKEDVDVPSPESRAMSPPDSNSGGLKPLTLTHDDGSRSVSPEASHADMGKSPSEAHHPPAPPPTASLAGAVEAAQRGDDHVEEGSDDEEPVIVEKQDVEDEEGQRPAVGMNGKAGNEADKSAEAEAKGEIAVRVDIVVQAEEAVDAEGKAIDGQAVGAAPASSSGVAATTKDAEAEPEKDEIAQDASTTSTPANDKQDGDNKAESTEDVVEKTVPSSKDMEEQKKDGDDAKGEAKEESKARDSVED